MRPPIAPALPLLLFMALGRPAGAAEFPTFEAQQIDPHVGNVCYAVTVADVDGDRKPDVVAVTEDAVVWFANPSWEKRDIIRGATERDNVCIQPRDIDGDGRVDFALGAAWRPTDTKAGGTLQWLRRTGPGDDRWAVVPIASEPTLHRLRWGDVLGAGGGKAQLVVAPLQGRGTKGPDWGAGDGSRVMVFTVPADPAKDAWPMEVADDSLHAVHNLQLVDLDGDGREDVLLASWEGVFALRRGADGRWSKERLGVGNQESKPNKGSSEIKLGRLADGRKYLATIEPWHGSQVVVYTAPVSGQGLWDRRVIDEPVQWGHAVWTANLDDDGDDELIVGQRDRNPDKSRETAGPGLYVFDPKPGPSSKLEFTRHVLDDGGVAVEDALAADLDGDGRADLIAGGRATHNVKIYWNRRSPTPK